MKQIYPLDNHDLTKMLNKNIFTNSCDHKYF